MAGFYRILTVAVLAAGFVESQSRNESLHSATPLVEFNVTDVELTTVKTTTTVATTAATSTTPTNSTRVSTSASVSPKPERDVKVEALSSTPVNCTAALENWITSDWKTFLEKVSSNGASDNFLATNFCELRPSNYSCLNDSKKPNDHSAHKKIAAIEAVKKDLCSKELKDLLTLAVNGSACLLAASSVTKDCLGSTKTYASPAEYFLRGNFSNAAECKNLTNANGCITSKLQTSPTCSADQQRVWGQVIRHLAPPSCDPETPAAASKNSGSFPLANGFLYSLPLVLLFKLGPTVV